MLPLSAQELQKADFSPGWSPAGKTRIFDSASLFQQINGGADLFLEFGFDTLWVQRYENNSGQELGLEMYRMTCPEAALGVYLFKCGTETPLDSVAARNSYDRFQITLLKGRYFIQVNNYDGDDSLVPELRALLAIILSGLPDRPVQIQTALPSENQVRGSIRLIRGPVAMEPIYTFGPGDIFQLNGERFALLADYEGDNGRYSYLRIVYDDSSSAQAVMNSLSSDLDPYLEKISVKPGRLTFKDWMDEYGIIKQRGSMIDIKFHLKTNPYRMD
jgi:hypothetical protein